MPSLFESDRGQSEALGFVLVFGIIVTTIAIASVAGYSGLENARAGQHAENAERAFTVLANNVDDMVQQGVPSRSTEIATADAQVEVGEPIHFNISGEATGSSANFSFNRSVRPVVYDTNADSRIVYAGGAVIREDRGGAVMSHQPDFLLTDQDVIVRLVQTRAPAERSVGGTSTVLVRTERADTEILQANTTEYDITFNVTSPRADAWERYLEAKPDTICTRPTEQTVSCTVTSADRVYVALVRVDVELN